MATDSVTGPSEDPMAIASLRRATPVRPDLWWTVAGSYWGVIAVFMTERLEKNDKALRDAAACRDWNDALVLWSSWSEDLLEDCSTMASAMVLASLGKARRQRRTRTPDSAISPWSA